MGDGLPFSVPSRHVRALRALGKLTDHEFNAVQESLASSSPSINSISALEHALAAAGSLTSGSARRIVLATIGLYVLHTSHGWELSQIVEQASKGKELELSGEEQRSLRHKLNELLSSKDVQLVAKAVDIVGEHSNNFHSSRVMTDMRPVFAESGEDGVDAAVITQTLILNYFDDAGQRRDFFLAMSDENMRKLQHDLARAEVKADAIRSLCESSKVRLIHGDSSRG